MSLKSVAERIAMWSGHYLLQILAVCLGLQVVQGVLADLHLLTGEPRRMSGIFIIVPMVYAVLSRRFHDRNVVLCNRHFHETPDDPVAAVERSRWALRLSHKFIPFQRMVWLVLPVAFAVQLLLYRALHVPAVLASIPLTLVCVGLAVLSWVLSVHERLQPWCPYCRGDGGKDQQVVPTDPTGTRLPSPA